MYKHRWLASNPHTYPQTDAMTGFALASQILVGLSLAMRQAVGGGHGCRRVVTEVHAECRAPHPGTPSPRAFCDPPPLRLKDRVLGEPVEQRTQPLASAVYRLDITHGVGVELAGCDERAVPEQVVTGMVGGVAAWNALHDVAADLVPVRGKRRHEILQRASGPVCGGRRTKQCDLLRIGVPPGGLDPQAVYVEAESDVDFAFHSHGGALVL